MSMVENDDEQSSAMHYCKVCKRGFSCGEALGGHMRAHGLVDARNYEDLHPPLSNSDDKSEGKHSYFLRTTANRFLSCKARESCDDKMSLTWPHNYENGKCTTNEMVSPNSWPLKYDHQDNDESCASSQEEEELANCLVMLSSTPFVFPTTNKAEEEKVVTKGGFQCRGCKKVFNSHQALGGHRASHKNVKGCFASSFDNLTNDAMTEERMNTNDEFLSPSNNNNYHFPEAAWCKKDGPVLEAARRLPWDPSHSKRKEKLHECSICFRVFSSGQALGGHKRCHWLSSNAQEKQVEDEPRIVYKKPMIRKSEDVDLSFSLMSSNLAHDEGVSRPSYVPITRAKEGGDSMSNFSGHEEESRKKVKVEKLSELRKMDLDGESSSWLQVGLASSR